MGKIIGEQLKPYVVDQIKVRQKAHGSGTDGTSRDLNQLTYLNSKTAWVKLASGVIVDEERLTLDKDIKIRDGFKGDSLAKHHVLFSGTSTLSSGSLEPRGTMGPSPGDNIWGIYNGTYNVNPTNKTSEFGLVPMPGITSVEVKCLNRGSIKRATVNIKCYSPEQFKIIDLLYLRIGYTMLLEWGNSLYIHEKDGTSQLTQMKYTLTEAENYGFYSGKWKESSYLGFLPVIEWYRKNRKGNYDGLLCKVVNFNWVFSQDGSYDINLELISLGDVVESLRINPSPSKNVISFINQTYSLYNEDVDEEKSIPPSPSDNWVSAYLFLQKLYIDKENNPEFKYDDGKRYLAQDAIAGKLGEGEYAKTLKLGGVFVSPPSGSIKITDGVETQSPGFETIEECKKWIENQNIVPPPTQVFDKAVQNVSKTNTYYIQEVWSDVLNGLWFDYVVYLKTFPELDPLNIENQTKKDIVYFSYNWGDTDEDQNIEDKGFYMRFGHLLQFISDYVVPVIKDTGTPILKIDNDMWTNKMYTLPYQVSLDPRVCIVNASIEPVNSKQFFPNLIQWKKISNNVDEAYGLTMNVYINHSQIMSSLNENKNEKGNVDLFGFLSSICTAVNKAMGGINNLEPIYDEDTHTICIIDGSYAPLEKINYTLELYGYNHDNKQSNFVRNFNLKTEITNDFATMATIGSTAGGYTKGVENTMFSKWNKGLTDPWKEKYTPPSIQNQENTEKEPQEMYVTDFWNVTYAAWGYVLKDVEDDLFTSDRASLSDEIIEKNLNIVSEFYKYCQSKIQEVETQYSSPTNGFVPISLGLTLDGISGIKIYNEINVDTRFLPQNYSDSLRFIIKGVNHKLSNSDWETNIETVVISQSGDKNRTPLPYYKIKQIIDGLIGEGISSTSPGTITYNVVPQVTYNNIPTITSNTLPTITYNNTPIISPPSTPNRRENLNLIQGQPVVDILIQFLKSSNIPQTQENIKFVKAWKQAESTRAKYSLFGSTQKYNNSTKFNSSGVQNYNTIEDSIKAHAKTIQSRYYPNLYKDLKEGKLTAIQIAERNLNELKTWGTGGLLMKVLKGGVNDKNLKIYY